MSLVTVLALLAIGCGIGAILTIGFACLVAASDADDRIEQAIRDREGR